MQTITAHLTLSGVHLIQHTKNESSRSLPFVQVEGTLHLDNVSLSCLDMDCVLLHSVDTHHYADVMFNSTLVSVASTQSILLYSGQAFRQQPSPLLI